jgi:hypothetical protein
MQFENVTFYLTVSLSLSKAVWLNKPGFDRLNLTTFKN